MGFKRVLIVLGCAPRRDGRPSDCMLARVRKALALYRKNSYSKVILSGGPHRFYVPEAEVMRIMLLKYIPDDRILIEPYSLSTVQNAVFSWELFKDKACEDITIVTSQFHMRRTMFIFKSLYKHTGASLHFESALDSFDIVQKVYYIIRESLMMLYHRIFGFR